MFASLLRRTGRLAGLALSPPVQSVSPIHARCWQSRTHFSAFLKTVLLLLSAPSPLDLPSSLSIAIASFIWFFFFLFFSVSFPPSTPTFVSLH